MTQKKATIATWLKAEDLDRIETLVDRTKRSNAAVLKYLLDQFVAGTLTPSSGEKAKVDRKQISTQADEDFKNAVDAKRMTLGLSMTELIIQLLNASDTHAQTQGEQK